MKKILQALTLLGSTSIICSAMATERPNIVLIVADDLGFTDTAPYGGEINTPTISQLAQQGIQFTNYHTAASCAPTRAMLLTGVDSHLAGVPNIPEAIPPEQAKHDHYQGSLSHNVVTVASLLQASGYHTYMSGKWHLGKEKHQLPFYRGFERTVSMSDTGADNWEQKPYLPIYKKANWTADGEEFQLPNDFYSSRFLVDKTIEFIDSNAGDEQPFFAYIPFQAVHIPIQAPKEFSDRYLETYKEGWEVLRKSRQANAKALGIVPADSDMVTMHTNSDWDALSEDDKRYNAKRMAVYAGMIEAMDFHIGRLVDHLKSTGQFENTIFIFTSDNGSEYNGQDRAQGMLQRFAMSLQGYSLDYDTLGEKGSFNTIGPSFASASAGPLAYYKFYAGEGGMRVPLIIAAEAISKSARISNAFTYVTDITPTILDLTDTKAPAQRFGGRPVETISGRSLTPLLNQESDRIYQSTDYVGYELGGHAALFQGDYKIVFNRGPVGDNQWRLYNIVRDPGETRDLSSELPQQLQAMLGNFEQYKRDNKVLPVPVGYDAVKQTGLNGARKLLKPSLTILLLAGFILVMFRFAYHQRQKNKQT
ncbi:arylsulfatase [uncultured Pseudoteredinibacter sp.]|uniref:arylsulfatase n=1 Tax=uncultured Pseudoteredinibacter sp. TaxID=1641701 RepID=UPI00260498E4|nr:arylsulfatase [uncultured Pseudoteredinibacter sp.]